MSVTSDEVFSGIRCAVCERHFGVGDDVVVVTATGERMHRECPEEECCLCGCDHDHEPIGFGGRERGHCVMCKWCSCRQHSATEAGNR